MPTLFDPVKIGALELPNRIVMAPLTRMRAFEERAPGPLNLEHYVQRASAGLILTEATSVTPQGVNGYLFDQFLHDGSNTRTDRYGGPVANRARLLLEAIDAMLKEWPAERVGVHLNLMSSSHSMKDSDPVGLFGYVAEQLNERK